MDEEKSCHNDNRNVKKNKKTKRHKLTVSPRVWLTCFWALNVWGRSPGCSSADRCLFLVFFPGTCTPAGHTFEPVVIRGGESKKSGAAIWNLSADTSASSSVFNSHYNLQKRLKLICCQGHQRYILLDSNGTNVQWKQWKNSFLGKLLGNSSTRQNKHS